MTPNDLLSFLTAAVRAVRAKRIDALLATAIVGTGSALAYAFDAHGRLVKREHRMGRLGGDSTTYRYDVHDDPVEETVEHRSREGRFDEVGNVHYSSDRVTLQHNRFEYRLTQSGLDGFHDLIHARLPKRFAVLATPPPNSRGIGNGPRPIARPHKRRQQRP
jgi:YD repeat-containing protein